jgi:hypothetical protein
MNGSHNVNGHRGDCPAITVLPQFMPVQHSEYQHFGTLQAIGSSNEDINTFY